MQYFEFDSCVCDCESDQWPWTGVRLGPWPSASLGGPCIYKMYLHFEHTIWLVTFQMIIQKANLDIGTSSPPFSAMSFRDLSLCQQCLCFDEISCDQYVII